MVIDQSDLRKLLLPYAVRQQLPELLQIPVKVLPCLIIQGVLILKSAELSSDDHGTAVFRKLQGQMPHKVI